MLRSSQSTSIGTHWPLEFSVQMSRIPRVTNFATPVKIDQLWVVSACPCIPEDIRLKNIAMDKVPAMKLLQILTLLVYRYPIACLTYDTDTDFGLTRPYPDLRSSLLALWMYEPHLCVSVFVLLSLPASDRSTFFVHIRLSLFFITPANHTLSFLHTFPLDYIYTTIPLVSVDTLYPHPLLESTNNLNNAALGRILEGVRSNALNVMNFIIYYIHIVVTKSGTTNYWLTTNEFCLGGLGGVGKLQKERFFRCVWCV